MGIFSLALNSTYGNHGLHSIGGNLSNSFPTVAGADNIGVIGQADGAPFNIGGVFEAGGSCGSSWNIGVYARAAQNNIFAPCSFGFAGYFDGPVYSSVGFGPQTLN